MFFHFRFFSFFIFDFSVFFYFRFFSFFIFRFFRFFAFLLRLITDYIFFKNKFWVSAGLIRIDNRFFFLNKGFFYSGAFSGLIEIHFFIVGLSVD